eukprot:GHRR01022310.1.p1 GENE.GHRR01022310.1~~GHRR01022310.1.p1  ORF type:complete len:152 (+),score=21.28 GHRR01022310.1:351-806(+)
MQQALARRGCTGIVVTRTLVSNTRLRPCRAVATKAAAKDNVFIPPWKDVFRTLKESGLRTISPEEASELLNSGTWVLLDVRRPDQHEESHPQGSVSVPMYSLIDMSKPDFAKVTLHMRPTVQKHPCAALSLASVQPQKSDRAVHHIPVCRL